MKRVFTIYMLLMTMCISAMAQNFTVSGIVTDAKTNEPLIGANVMIKNESGLGVITDANGKFTFKGVNEYQILVFSYIGYDNIEIPIKDQRVFKVQMNESDNNVLNEVVITGTGSKTKVNLTGAITTVEVAQLQAAPSANISNALAGVVPGIQAQQTSGKPGSTSEFWIRGISTFGANTKALVLVDGFERNLDEINVEDVESFSVLKDASETAIYGSKGANGVVLITTRHGKDGKIKINAKVESFYNTFTKLPDFVDGYQYASMANEARLARSQEALYTPQELEMFRLNLDPDLYPNVDWMDVMLRDGSWSQRGSISLTGGGSTARYYASGSYINQQGMYATDSSLKDYNTNANYHRWNYRMNLDIDITKTTLMKFGISGSLEKSNDTGAGTYGMWNTLMGYSPISCPIQYSDGKWATNQDEGGTAFNPWVQATQTGYQENWNNNIQATLEFLQKLDFITKGLNFTFRFGYDTYNSNWIKRYKYPEQYKATPRFRDQYGNLQLTRTIAEKTMEQTAGSSGSRNEFLEWQFNYNRQFGNRHNVGGVFKYNQSSKIQTQNIGSDIENGIARRNQGWAGRLDYNWYSRYYANVNFGYTGSENFHKDHRWGFFPAASVAWNISEEPIVKRFFPWLDLFKVRYSWGKVGNDNLGNDRFPYLYSIGCDSGFNFGDYNHSRSYSGKKYTELASTDVSWEEATKKDLGLDFSIFSGAFTGTVDYFEERREGIYMSRNYLPSFIGLESTPKANVGIVESKGFDGNIAFNCKFKDVDVTLRANMTYSKNEIIEKDEESTVYYYLTEEGHRVNQAMGLIALGLFKDYEEIRNSPNQQFGTVMPGDIKYKDVNGDGVVNGSDKVAIGATTKPNLTYGFGASAKWRGFDLNLLFQGVGKSSFFIEGSTVFMFRNGDGGGNVLSQLANGNRWIPREISGTADTEDPNATYPRLSYGGNNNNQQRSTFWLQDGSYMRLKTFELGYSLPKKVTRAMYCNNVRVFFIGTNLLTWSGFKLWDPELTSSDGKAYPLTRSFSLGVTINL